MKKTYSILLILFFLQSSSFLAMETSRQLMIYSQSNKYTSGDLFEIYNDSYQDSIEHFFSTQNNNNSKAYIPDDSVLRFAYDIVSIANFFPHEHSKIHNWTKEKLKAIIPMNFAKRKLFYKLYYLKDCQNIPKTLTESASRFIDSVSGKINDPDTMTHYPTQSVNFLLESIDKSELIPWHLRWTLILSLHYHLKMCFEKIKDFCKKYSSNNSTTINNSNNSYNGGEIRNEQDSYLSTFLNTTIYPWYQKIKNFLSKKASDFNPLQTKNNKDGKATDKTPNKQRSDLDDEQESDSDNEQELDLDNEQELDLDQDNNIGSLLDSKQMKKTESDEESE